jgi:hypothetical protein
MGRTSPNSQRSNKTGIGCGILALLLLVGGCNQLLNLGDDESKSDDCAMAPAAHAGPPGLIGGGNGSGGGGGFTNGGSSTSSGGSSGSGSGGLDTEVPDYEPGMDPNDVTQEMRDQAETDHGEMRAVGRDLIWFDKRTGDPFPWHKKAYEKAKREADAVEDALADLDEDC